MENFSNNRVTKNNSKDQLKQFSLWARKDTDQIFLPDFSLTFEVFLQFSWTFPGFP